MVLISMYNGKKEEKVTRNNWGSMPVSYTHLDVYKRQVYKCL